MSIGISFPSSFLYASNNVIFPVLLSTQSGTVFAKLKIVLLVNLFNVSPLLIRFFAKTFLFLFKRMFVFIGSLNTSCQLRIVSLIRTILVFFGT